MKSKIAIFYLFLLVITASCSKSINYSPEFMAETSGKYLYNHDDIIEIFYENEKLFLKWRGAEKIAPICINETTFFIADMYKKLQFVTHPETKKRYLSILKEGEEQAVSYDFLKVKDTYKTPSMYLKDKQYDKALVGFLEIQKQDSTSVYISERDFNRMGYEFLRKKKYTDAIEVFKLNIELHPESDNAYDSLGAAYSISGDSLQAYNNYKKALEFNNRNGRAKKYVESYKKKVN